MNGFQIHALDGDIVHLDDFLVDDENRTIECAIVDTKNWDFGSPLPISPTDINKTDYFERYVPIASTRCKIKCSPSRREPDRSDRPAPRYAQYAQLPRSPATGE